MPIATRPLPHVHLCIHRRHEAKTRHAEPKRETESRVCSHQLKQGFRVTYARTHTYLSTGSKRPKSTRRSKKPRPRRQQLRRKQPLRWGPRCLPSKPQALRVCVILARRARPPPRPRGRPFSLPSPSPPPSTAGMKRCLCCVNLLAIVVSACLGGVHL